MKILLFLTFIVLFSSVVFTQTEQDKLTFLSPKAMKKRIVKYEFSDVPTSVRDCHWTGQFILLIQVEPEGKVETVRLVSGLCEVGNEYVEKTVANWKFKPLKVNNKKVPFKGMIIIPFWYGSFP